MEIAESTEKPAGKSPLMSVILTLPMMAVTALILSRGKVPAGFGPVLAFTVIFTFFNGLFFLMVRTGKTDRYRAILFITYSVAFVISFISHLIEVRGSMALTEAAMMEGKAPFCHIVIPMTLIPAAFTRTIIFPGSIVGAAASISSMFILWIGASLSLGRGFCGWGCFFGGLEDGFSRILKKPVIRHISPVLTYLPFAVLLAVVLGAAVTLSPFYCLWLCPFKTVTEYVEITSFKIMVQTIIFVSLFAGLVVILPLLTRRRTQCGLFCPFGAFQSFTNKVNAFDVRIDRERCVDCGKCARLCPTFSMSEGSVKRGGPEMTCMKCGKCVDGCPKGAISFHVKGTLSPSSGETSRILFLYPAFLFLAAMSGGNMTDVVVRIVKLIGTGSMI